VIPRPGRRDTSAQPWRGSGVPSAMRSFTSMLMSMPFSSSAARAGITSGSFTPITS
jgi:hypothetical protein